MASPPGATEATWRSGN